MFLKICFKGIVNGKLKTALNMAVCAMGVAISTSLLGLVYDIRSQMQKELMPFGPNFVIQPRLENEESGINKKQFLVIKKVLSSLKKDSVLSPSLFGAMTVKKKSGIVCGVQFENQKKLCGHWEIKGNWAGNAKEVMVGERAAQEFTLRLGDRFEFEETPGYIFVVRGIFRSGGSQDNQILADLNDARSLMGGSIWISTVDARINGSLEELENISGRLETALPDLKAKPIRRVALSEGQVLDRIESLIWIVNLLIFAIVGLTVLATSTTLVSERREEFALARALGASYRQLSTLFYAETLIGGLAASPLGFLLGFICLNVFARHLFSTQASFRWEIVPGILIAVAAVILIGGGLAVKRIFQIEPAVVLKGE